MNKFEFLTIFKTERARLEAILKPVRISQMNTPGVSGVYSIKDILAHLEAYDRALIIWLREAKAGRIYIDSNLDQADIDARNAIVYKNNSDRNATDILSMFRLTLDELETEVQALTDDELTNAGRTAWFVVPRWQQPQELWTCIANDSYEHHQQHLPDIEHWLAKNTSTDLGF